MINKCTFIGNLGRDPELKETESGHKVISISIACSRKMKNKETGETTEYTEWIPIVAWDSLAEIIAKYARKGSQVYVEGEFRTRSYDTESGEKRYVSEIWARDIRLLGRKQESVPLPESPDGSATQGAKQAAPQTASVPQQPKQGNLDLHKEEDDLPF